MSSPSFSAKSPLRELIQKSAKNVFFSSPRGALTPILFSLILLDLREDFAEKMGLRVV